MRPTKTDIVIATIHYILGAIYNIGVYIPLPLYVWKVDAVTILTLESTTFAILVALTLYPSAEAWWRIYRAIK